MKRWMLGLLLLVGCVACESDEYVSPPPYVEEIEAFDWSVVDAEALEGRLTSDVWEMVEYWSGNGGNGWIPLSILDMISHRRNWGYLFFEDGTCWNCLESWGLEVTSEHELFHQPYRWAFDREQGALQFFDATSDRLLTTFYVLYYQGDRLIIGEKPSSDAANSESMTRYEFELVADAEQRVEWMEKFEPTK